VIAYGPAMLAGFAGAAAASSTVAYADTIIEIIHGGSKLTISTKDDDYPLDLNYPPHGLSDTLKDFPNWVRRGCGDQRYYCPEKKATFSPNGVTPIKMPNLAKHNSIMADVLNSNTSLWDLLRNKTTNTGVSLSDCIKTGVDNSDWQNEKIVGIVAGDEDSYEAFKELFDPIINLEHQGWSAEAVHLSNMDCDKLSNRDVDAATKYILTNRMSTGRSIRGFQLPPVIAFDDRRKLEKLLVKALLQMEGDLAGEYFPLHGSRSWEAMPNGMSREKEAELRRCGCLFRKLDSTLLLASGMARHWPDARGIFHNIEKNLFIKIGEDDHLQIVSRLGDLGKPTEKATQIREVAARLFRACAAIEKVLKENGYEFMHSDHLGWVRTCPSNLGAGIRCATVARLPHISSRKDWKPLVKAMRLQARGKGSLDSTSQSGVWEVSNVDRIGKGETEIVNILIDGVAQLVEWETMFDSGKAHIADRQIKAQISKAREVSSHEQ